MGRKRIARGANPWEARCRELLRDLRGRQSGPQAEPEVHLSPRAGLSPKEETVGASFLQGFAPLAMHCQPSGVQEATIKPIDITPRSFSDGSSQLRNTKTGTRGSPGTLGDPAVSTDTSGSGTGIPTPHSRRPCVRAASNRKDSPPSSQRTRRRRQSRKNCVYAEKVAPAGNQRRRKNQEFVQETGSLHRGVTTTSSQRRAIARHPTPHLPAPTSQ